MWQVRNKMHQNAFGSPASPEPARDKLFPDPWSQQKGRGGKGGRDREEKRKWERVKEKGKWEEEERRILGRKNIKGDLPLLRPWFPQIDIGDIFVYICLATHLLISVDRHPHLMYGCSAIRLICIWIMRSGLGGRASYSEDYDGLVFNFRQRQQNSAHALTEPLPCRKWENVRSRCTVDTTHVANTTAHGSRRSTPTLAYWTMLPTEFF